MLQKHAVELPTILFDPAISPTILSQGGLCIVSSSDISMLQQEAYKYGEPIIFLLNQIVGKVGENSFQNFLSKPIRSQTQLAGTFVWIYWDVKQTLFERYESIRDAWLVLLEMEPKHIGLLALGGASTEVLQEALYVGLLSAAPKATWKKEPEQSLQSITLFNADLNTSAVIARARAQVTSRWLIDLPPNILTPKSFYDYVIERSHVLGLEIEQWNYSALEKIGAGAFCAVAKGSCSEDASIIRISWRPPNPSHAVSLVGKGVCFDSGGYHLKQARYMQGMHRDMAGAAVVWSLIEYAASQNHSVAIDAWLVLADNLISPQAYLPGQVITALDGTTVEIVHTDAEGRLLLADTLVLANRYRKNHVVISFATLTGSMITALGSRLSGVFTSNDTLRGLAELAATMSAERVCYFPMFKDYDKLLESAVADICQCTLDSEADHILAACFLKRFAGSSWIHLDLSAMVCPGGLGAMASDTTAFGVAWGIALLSLLKRSGTQNSDKLPHTLGAL